MIIVPTRELAIQIAESLEGLSYFTDVSSIAVYGGGDGNSFNIEKKALTHGVDIVVCTPGRMIAHLNMGYVKLKGLKYLVLDEADRMLDMGFNDDIMKIISFLPKERQNLLFSATLNPNIESLQRVMLNNPLIIQITSEDNNIELINQTAYAISPEKKGPLLRFLIESKNMLQVLIFTSSAYQADAVVKKTAALGECTGSVAVRSVARDARIAHAKALRSALRYIRNAAAGTRCIII